MPKVFDLRSYIAHSIEAHTPNEIIILSCITCVPDVLGKTKDEIQQIGYMNHADILFDEWFSEKEEEPNGTSQHITLQN